MVTVESDVLLKFMYWQLAGPQADDPENTLASQLWRMKTKLLSYLHRYHDKCSVVCYILVNLRIGYNRSSFLQHPRLANCGKGKLSSLQASWLANYGKGKLSYCRSCIYHNVQCARIAILKTARTVCGIRARA